jgi:hypothetical protein
MYILKLFNCHLQIQIAQEEYLERWVVADFEGAGHDTFADVILWREQSLS